MRAGFAKRLPLLAIAAVGIWLWNSGLFPQSRELTWHLPADSSIDAVEIQLWDPGGHLVKREQRFGAVATPLIQKISLKQGTYDARVFMRRSARETQWHTSFYIGRAAEYALEVQ